MTDETQAEVTPQQVMDARLGASKRRKMRATEAGAIVYVSGRMWRRYETGQSVMPTAYFELFLIKTGQVMKFAGVKQ